MNYTANYATLTGYGTTILWAIVVVVTASLVKSQINNLNLDRDVITKSLITQNVAASPVFEPPDDSSPDRTSGLGSRSSRQGGSNA